MEARVGEPGTAVQNPPPLADTVPHSGFAPVPFVLRYCPLVPAPSLVHVEAPRYSRSHWAAEPTKSNVSESVSSSGSPAPAVLRPMTREVADTSCILAYVTAPFAMVTAPVAPMVASPLAETGAYAVPPRFPTGICQAAGAVFGTIEALVCTSSVTFESPTAAFVMSDV